MTQPTPRSLGALSGVPCHSADAVLLADVLFLFVQMLTSSLNTGSLLKGATDEAGNLKPAALMVGLKLDLEAEVHLTARIRGDITIGLY